MTEFTKRTVSPFRYDIVGSFLRPQALKEARAKFTQGQISRDDLTKVEDKCIIDLVNKEEAAGLHAVTDGEFRRSYWHLDTFWGFAGIKHTTQTHGYLFHDEETRKDSAQVSGKIAFKPGHTDVEAFKFLKKITKDKDVIPRQSIPAPAQFYAELVRGDENIAALRKYYPTDDELFHDIAEAYHDLILALYDAGCRDVKIDDCTWGMVVDDDFWATMAKAGFDRESLENIYLKLNNDAIAGLPDDLTVNTHICRGNYHSTWPLRVATDPLQITYSLMKTFMSFILNMIPIVQVALNRSQRFLMVSMLYLAWLPQCLVSLRIHKPSLTELMKQLSINHLTTSA